MSRRAIAFPPCSLAAEGDSLDVSTKPQTSCRPVLGASASGGGPSFSRCHKGQRGRRPSLLLWAIRMRGGRQVFVSSILTSNTTRNLRLCRNRLSLIIMPSLSNSVHTTFAQDKPLGPNALLLLHPPEPPPPRLGQHHSLCSCLLLVFLLQSSMGGSCPWW